MANEVEIILTADEKQALAAFNSVSKAAQKFESQQKQSASQESKRRKKQLTGFKKLEKSLKSLSTASQTAIGVIAGQAIIGAFGAITRAASDFFGTIKDQTILLETLGTQFEIVTGSAEKAALVLKEIQEFAAATPFEFPELAKTAQSLIAFGFESSTVVSRLKVLGDVAAGTGRNLGEIGLIFAQVSAAGKLTGERLLQLEERGIIIGPALAKSFGISESAVRSLVSSGKVGFAEFEEAFKSLTEEGGTFFDATSKRSQTLQGLISTLNDNFNQLAGDIGTQLLPQFKELVQIITEFIQQNKEGFLAATKATTGFFTAMVEAAAGAGKFFTDNFTDPVNKGLRAVKVELIDIEQQIFKVQDEISKKREAGIGTAVAEANLKRLQDGFKALSAIEEKKEQEDIQRAADKKAREEQAAADSAASESKRITLIEALRLTQEEIEAERRAGDTELSQIRADEDFAALEDNLGRTKALQVKREVDELLRAGKQSEALTKLKKAQLEADKKGLQSLFDFEKNTNAGRAANFKSTLGTISTLQSSNNKTLFAIGKAAALATGTIDGIAAVQKALASAPPPFNFILATLVGVATAANLAKIAASKPPSFQQGGVVPGTSFSGDNVTANVNSGELILNRAQQGVIQGDLTQSQQTQQAILSALEGLNSQPTVVQIDGREIARTVRDEGEAGFAFAV